MGYSRKTRLSAVLLSSVFAFATASAQAQECEGIVESADHVETPSLMLARSRGGAFHVQFGIRDGAAYLRGRYETQSRRRALFSVEHPMTLRLADASVIELVPDAASTAAEAATVFSIPANQLLQMSTTPLAELTIHVEYDGVLELDHRDVRPKRARAILESIRCLPSATLRR